MPEGISENRALNPTRAWGDDPEVRLHLRFITKKHADHVNLLRRLSEEISCTLENDDQERVRFLNKISEAYGYVNLVKVEDDCFSLDPNARDQLAVVLSPGYRGGM